MVAGLTSPLSTHRPISIAAIPGRLSLIQRLPTGTARQITLRSVFLLTFSAAASVGLRATNMKIWTLILVGFIVAYIVIIYAFHCYLSARTVVWYPSGPTTINGVARRFEIRPYPGLLFLGSPHDTTAPPEILARAYTPYSLLPQFSVEECVSQTGGVINWELLVPPVVVCLALVWYMPVKHSGDRCKSCGYSLTGTPRSTGRCPECTQEFVRHKSDGARYEEGRERSA